MFRKSRIRSILPASLFKTREWTVKLVPANGGEEVVVKNVQAGTADLAMRLAAGENPGYIAKSARCTKIIRQHKKNGIGDGAICLD